MFTNRVRLPIFFSQPQFPVERNVFRKANGDSKVLSMVIRNTYQGKTDQLPEDWHRKLVIALGHDTVNIEGERLLSQVVLNGDYEINWQDFLNYPIAPAQFAVEVTPFNATNDNCQTCEEMTQLNLVDDSTDEVWGEGETHEFPDVLTDNDHICCAPYTIELVYYNTDFFSACSISADGVLTATVIDPAPVMSNIFIARYRVTCEGGMYDEADVYGNITGSDTEFCYPAGGEGLLFYQTGNPTTIDVTLDAIHIPLPAGWNWELFLSSDLGTPIQSGSWGPGGGGTLTGLSPGVPYTLCVVADCGSGNYSLPVCKEFQITAFAGETCGQFTVTYIPSVDSAPQSYSYMDCAGDVHTETLGAAREDQVCMLIPFGGTTPVYFVASSVDISIAYTSLCNAYD